MTGFVTGLDIASLEQDTLDNVSASWSALHLRAGNEGNNALRGHFRLDLCHFEGNAQAIRSA